MQKEGIGIMKVISILGSPRGIKGYTGSLLKPVLEAAQNAGAETELFSLGDLLVKPCKGCLEICHTKGKCHQKDDFEKIKNAMIEADGIIYASPNYNLTVSAQMKALIDRCGLMLHCQQLTGKYVAMVVTSGGSDPEDVVNYFRSIIKLYGFWIVGSIEAVEAQFEDAEEKAKLMESATALGNRMVNAIKNQEIFPEQEDDRNQSFEIMKYMVMMLKERWPVAWDYWNTHWEMEEENE
jgi:multimeric flavodoxin WrbA